LFLPGIRSFLGCDARKELVMKKVLALVALLTAALASAQTNASPAERSITEARAAIAKKPDQFAGYNRLAVALSRRARETSDVNYYAQAEDALKKSFDLSPNNLEAEKIRIWLLLGRHEFPKALEAATAVNKRVPDDVLVYGFLTDANAELGNYDAAEKAAQWMLDLRPGNLPGMTRAAYLREIFGDAEGALELMDMAYQSTPPTEFEDRAWILSQMGHLNLISGKPEQAEQVLQQALKLFPDYHYALANLAKLRIEQKRYDEAVALLRVRYQNASHAENLYDLAEALRLAGKTEDAAKAFTEFESKSLAESERADNSNRELIFYYSDRIQQPIKALEVARREFAWRHDVYTLDAYAWALHVNGQDAEARKQMERALAVGIRDANLFFHAGEIAVACGDQLAGERYLREAVSLKAPGSEQAGLVLASLNTNSASR
jgi:tetratricopeptide (TPR) repeat protein